MNRIIDDWTVCAAPFDVLEGLQLVVSPNSARESSGALGNHSQGRSVYRFLCKQADTHVQKQRAAAQPAVAASSVSTERDVKLWLTDTPWSDSID